MLSAFSRLRLNSGDCITLKPLLLPELQINELLHEDLMRYFNEPEPETNEHSQMKNDYYCKAVLKLSNSIMATFESNFNYVQFKMDI